MKYAGWENIHDKYCPMLYGVAIEICPVQKEAEQILLTGFKKIHAENITPQKYPAYGIALLRVIIKTARELYPVKFKNNFRLKQFENTPLLNLLLCEDISFHDYCKEKYITPQAGMELIRKEFNLLKTVEKENIVSFTTSIASETEFIYGKI